VSDQKRVAVQDGSKKTFNNGYRRREMHPIPNSRLILGPPGCGKTHTLIEIVREALAKGIHPSRIAFVSFTTKAVREALDRACAEFNLEPKQLPNFRTLHATGYHALGLQRTDVMARADYKALGDMLGVEFKGSDRTSVDDGIVLPTIGGSGAKYIQSVMRARYREVSLEREYNEAEDYSLSYQKLVQVHEQNEEYKTKMGKQDFVDMIALYPVMAEPIYLDLLIVDEASQSYRLPRSVWRLAKSITARIEDRIPKDFYPKDEEGSVQSLMRLGDAPMDQGSWTIMARTNTFCQGIADKLEQMGYYYSVKGVPSVGAKLLQNMNTWKTLSLGGTVGLQFVRDLYGAVPKVGDGALVRRGATKLLSRASPLLSKRFKYSNISSRIVFKR
jgi:hypothetical protein